MTDFRDELVQALQTRLTGLNGVRVHYDTCNPFSTSVENLGDSFIVNHVTRVFDSVQFDNLVSFFENEVVQYLKHLQDSNIKVSDLLFLFREVPSYEKWNKVRYISIVRKKP